MAQQTIDIEAPGDSLPAAGAKINAMFSELYAGDEAAAILFGELHDRSAVSAAIAALSASNDDVLQLKAGGWTNRSVDQLKQDLLAVSSQWVFGGAGLGSSAAVIISSTAPCFTWDDQDAGSNARRWNARVNGTSWILEAINSADAGQKQILHVQRASLSSTITTMIYGNTADAPSHSFRGDIIAAIAGRGIQIKEGANARMGVATLVGGTVTVANTTVTAVTRVRAFHQSDGGTPGFLRCSGRVVGTSFTITSGSATDTSVIMWELVEPAP